MKYTCISFSQPFSVDLYVIPFFSGARIVKHPFSVKCLPLDRAYIEKVAREVTRDLEVQRITLPASSAKVLLVCLGEKEVWSARKYIRAVRKIFHAIKAARAKTCALALDDFAIRGMARDRLAEHMASNALLALYEFNHYRADAGETLPTQTMVVIGEKKDVAPLARALTRGAIIGEQTNMTRDLVNIPGGDMTPTSLAAHARRAARKCGVTAKVLTKADMEKLGMGAILGVARGSTEEPKLIVMEYFGGPKKKKPIVFVGKGVTFDTGGINLKPSHGMDEMYMDMSGGAAVISAVCAIARLGLKTNVVGVIPAVENMPSGSSYRPGDILKSMSGTTIEIRNTDAEGRVIMSDAFTYSERYTPSLVVDVATLTGACMIALGDYAFAVLSPSDALARSVQELGEASGDYCWPLPMWEEYEHDIRGTVGDVVNASKNHPRGGTINAAFFLAQFTKKFPKWVHLDIASTMTSAPLLQLSSGASGTGTRLLIEIARSL